MTEDEWRACSDPRNLLDYHRMKKDARRLRLLAVACVRAVVLSGPWVEEVFDVVERYADGAANRAEFLAARKAVRQAAKTGHPEAALLGSGRGLTGDAMESLTGAIHDARGYHGPGGGATECELIRCVFGNPYRPTVFAPAWLTFTVVALARGVYDDRAFDHLPILADALQDAGCADETVLTHCRDRGAHARGCWVVDGLRQ